MGDIIRFSAARKVFTAGGQEIRAVDDVSFSIAAGDVVGVIGYSGAGKSTLVRLINGLESPTSGQVEVLGRDIASLREAELRVLRAEIGMVFQQFNLFSARRVASNVAYPLKLAGIPVKQREARVNELLEFVGIADKARSFPAQLSGGQKQRVGIARALATNPKILLADEATSALDPETTRDVLQLLRKVNEEFGTTIVVITHEMDVVRSLCHKVAVMENGALLEFGPVYDVFSQPKAQATKRFVQSVLHDVPSPETMGRLRARYSGQLVSIAVRETMAGTSTSVAVGDVLRRHPRVHAHVVFGGISEISARAFGSLIYELRGEAMDIETLLGELQAVADVVTDVVSLSHELAAPAAGEKEASA